MARCARKEGQLGNQGLLFIALSTELNHGATVTAEQPDVVWHYTDGTGLLGILRGKLWLTHYAYLNDSREYGHLSTLGMKALSQLAEKGNDRVAEFARVVLVHLNEYPEYAGGPWYVACFSAADDDVNQWRAYTKPGARYAVGFNVAALRNLCIELELSNAGLRAIFNRVQYISNEEAEVQRIQEQFRQSIEKEEPKLFAGSNYRERPASDAHSAELMYIYGKIVYGEVIPKDAAFESEQEWRIYLEGRLPRDVLFRPGASFLVPYVEIDLPANDPSAIAEVVCGPAPNAQLAISSVKLLLREMGNRYAQVNIRPSTCPYRDW